MGPLQDLGQTTSVMMGLLWWGIRPQGSARVMAIGTGAYPGALQRNQVCMFVLLSPSAQRCIYADWFKFRLYSIEILLQSRVSNTWKFELVQNCHTCSFFCCRHPSYAILAAMVTNIRCAPAGPCSSVHQCRNLAENCFKKGIGNSV